MKYASTGVVLVFGSLCIPLAGAQPADWKVVKERSGTCQISVPSNWTTLSAPGFANSPELTTTILTASDRPFATFDDNTLKALHISKLYENSTSRVFYVSKTDDAGRVRYHIEVPGKPGGCIAEMTLTARYPEDEAKQIAMTLRSVE